MTVVVIEVPCWRELVIYLSYRAAEILLRESVSPTRLVAQSPSIYTYTVSPTYFIGVRELVLKSSILLIRYSKPYSFRTQDVLA